MFNLEFGIKRKSSQRIQKQFVRLVEFMKFPRLERVILCSYNDPILLTSIWIIWILGETVRIPENRTTNEDILCLDAL
jgi:hypothetical protein